MENIIGGAALGGLDDDVVEEAVLHELLMQRVPPLLRERQFGHFNLNLLSDQEVQLNFRFNRDDLERLRIALRVPNELKTPNGYSVNGLTGLCMYLRRLAYPAQARRVPPTLEQYLT